MSFNLPDAGLGEFDFIHGDLSASDLVWLTAIGLGLHAVWLVYRWHRLKKEIFPGIHGASAEKKAAAPAPEKIDAALLLRVLRNVKAAIEAESSPAAGPLLTSWVKAEPHLGKFCEAAEPVVLKTLDLAHLDGLLCALGGDYLYMVVVPNRHEHPHLLRRNSALSAGWREHLLRVRSALEAGESFSSILSFLLFLSPDSQDCVALVSWANEDQVILPSGLATREDLRAENVLATDARVEFAISAPPALPA